MMKRALTVIILLLLTLTTASCSPYAYFASNDYSGETLDREMLESIAESIFTEEEQTDGKIETNETDATESLSTELSSEDLAETCYWTEGGSVWHKDVDCRYLKNSKEIVSGTVEDAIGAGKERACSGCCK